MSVATVAAVRQEASLPERLGRLRTRVLRIGLAAAGAWAAAAAVVLLLVAVWLDLLLECSPELRIGLSGGALGGGVIVLLLAGRGAWRRGVPQMLARRLDSLRQTGGQILAAVDLLLQGPLRCGRAEHPSDALTTGLAELAVARAAVLAGGVETACAVPARAVARSGGALLALLGAVALAAVLLPGVFRTQWLRFSDPWGDHPPYSPLTFTVEPGEVHVVYGDGLDVRATAVGRPVERLELLLESGAGGAAQSGARPAVQVLPMFPEPGGAWRATLASVTDPGRYCVRVGRARSRRFAIEVITVPRLENARFRITPPAYTAEPPYEGPLPAGGLAGLVGTRVQVWLTSNRPLSGGVAEVSGAGGVSTTALTAPKRGDAQGEAADSKGTGPAHEVTGTFEVREPGKVRFSVTDVAGQPSRENLNTTIVILPDQRPFVRLTQPQQLSFATPDFALPVAVAAEDDYGVARVQLFRSLNNSRPLPTDLVAFAPGPPAAPARRVNEATRLPLDRYGLRPGDIIRLFARVADNDPTGAKGAESPFVQVQIISQEDFAKLIEQRQGLETLLSKYQQAQRRLEALLAQIEELQQQLKDRAADAELSAEERARLERLAEQMAEDAREVAKAANAELPFDVDRTLNMELKNIAHRLEKAARDAADMAAARPAQAGATRRGLEDLHERLSKHRQQYREQVLEPLDKLAAAVPLMEDQARFVQLAQAQEDLAHRVQALKGVDQPDDPEAKVRMRDLEAEQAALRSDLLRLLDDIEAHAARLPEDEQFAKLRQTAEDFAAAVRESAAEKTMQAAETALAEFSGTRAAQQAEEAAAILDSFIKKCSGMGEQAGQCLAFQPSLGECLSATAQQLLAGAGLGVGPGGGSGYSMRMPSLQNVGLYGALPLAGDAGQRADMTNTAAVQRSAPEDAGRGESSDLLQVLSRESLRAAGASENNVPARYRRRVADYFQRISDDLED